MRAQPFCSNFALLVVAAGSLVVQECTEARLVLDGFKAVRTSRLASTGCGGRFIERSIVTRTGTSAVVRAVVSETKVPRPT